MRHLFGTASNVFCSVGKDDEIQAHVELILYSTELQLQLVGNKTVNVENPHTDRYVVSVESLREISKHLSQYADAAEELQKRIER